MASAVTVPGVALPVINQVAQGRVPLIHRLTARPVQLLPVVVLGVAGDANLGHRRQRIGEVHDHPVEDREGLAGRVLGW